jgi:hypothetical protein
MRQEGRIGNPDALVAHASGPRRRQLLLARGAGGGLSGASGAREAWRGCAAAWTCGSGERRVESQGLPGAMTSGAVLGKSLAMLEHGQGLLPVLITLQYVRKGGYYDERQRAICEGRHRWSTFLI